MRRDALALAVVNSSSPTPLKSSVASRRPGARLLPIGLLLAVQRRTRLFSHAGRHLANTGVHSPEPRRGISQAAYLRKRKDAPARKRQSGLSNAVSNRFSGLHMREFAVAIVLSAIVLGGALLLPYSIEKSPAPQP